MIFKELQSAKRPILIYGWGVRLSGAETEAYKFARFLPVCPTWAVADLLLPHRVGTFGTHGIKAGNLAVQNADLIISVGSRLDSKATADVKTFAPKAKIYMVDIDQGEIDKFKHLGREVFGINQDAKEFLKASPVVSCQDWLDEIEEWKKSFPPGDGSEAYKFVENLEIPEDIIVSDTGSSLVWMMQSFRFRGQRFFHAFNNTPMGYGLPASIGLHYATGKKICLITGDGGLSVNIGEMATIQRHKLPIRIILFNNRGHGMCRQTQRQWFNGVYNATSYETGLACPDFKQIAKSYEVELQEVNIGPECGISPMVKFGESLQ